MPTLARNRVVLGQLVGASNYDVGHIGLGVDGGGVAYLGVVGADYKGGGCTGLAEPKGDFFAIDYVAHELGHQYAGNHTFNGDQWNAARRQPRAEHVGGAGVRLVGDGLRRHLQAGQPAAAQRSLLLSQDAGRGQRLHQQPNGSGGRGADGVPDGLRDPATPLTPGSGSPSAPIPARTTTPRQTWRPVESSPARNVSIAEWGYDPFFDFPRHRRRDGARRDRLPGDLRVAALPGRPGTATFEDFPSLSVTGCRA